MDWALKHLQLIIAIAGAVAWWLNQRKQAQAGDAEAPKKEATFEDPDLAERTRRIREDIQRKIAERAKAYTQTPAAPQPVVRKAEPVDAPPILREVARRPVEQPTLSRAATSHAEAQRNAEILEQQVALAEKLREATELKVAALRRMQFENQVSTGDQAAVVARGALGDDLRNPDSLRRAFILREIIGPPVGLR